MSDIIEPLRFFNVQKVLPAVYGDELSYYELLAKMEQKINEEVGSINDQNVKLVLMQKAIDDFTAGGYKDDFEQFLDTWFAENLDTIEQYLHDGFAGELDEIRESVTTSQEQTLGTVADEYVPFPVEPASKYGTDGQVLRTNGDGTTLWQAPLIPTDQQAETYINAWLNEHPEATTTVQDGSLTTTKYANNSITDAKLVQSGGVLTRVNSINESLLPFRQNLINPEDVVVYSLDFYSGTHEFVSSARVKIVVMPCKQNTSYTILQTLKSFRFCCITSTDFPENHVRYNRVYNKNNNYASPITLVTTDNDNYIAIKFYNSDGDTNPYQDYLNTLMMAEGDVTEFHEYTDLIIPPESISSETYELIDARTETIVAEAIEGITTDYYGIRINTDGSVTRIGQAAGKTNDYVIGNAFVGDGTNDFDNIYPWSEIRTCNIKVDSYGDLTITYEGESGFARNGSNGSVYVEIPKFFTKRFVDENGNENILISGTRDGGFVVEPAFYDSVTGEEIEHIYVGAYLTQTGVSTLNSLSGVFPESNVSLDSLRTRSGEMYDFVTLQAIQKLMSIEFGRINFSSVFGGFSYLPWSSSVKASGSATNTNTGNFSGDLRIANIGVGNTISVAPSVGRVQNRTVTAIGEVTQESGRYFRSITFDGEPVDLVDNTTMLYCTGQRTGFTDTLTYHTGRTNLNSGSTFSNQFRYRGIEGLWGTLGEIMNGIIVKDLKAYWCNIKSDYEDISKYHRLNFPVPLQNTYSNSPQPLPPQIKEMGFDFRYPTIAFPKILAPISQQYYGDLFFSLLDTSPEGRTFPAGTEFIGISSMAWDGHDGNGPYTIRFWSVAQDRSWLYGTRAIIRHF